MSNLSAIQWGCSIVMVIAILHLIWVDIRSLRIPDADNLVIALSGAGYQFAVGEDALVASLITGVCVTSLLYLARSAYMALVGRVGLGLGDVKLIGAASLWFSAINLPLFMLFASMSALSYAFLCSGVQGGDWKTRRIPFGPFLGIALIIVWLSETFLNVGLL